MVRRHAASRALNRKLLRDLRRDEGAGARHRDGRGGRRLDVRDVPVELRLAAGARAPRYYDRQRFADVFASLKRAPAARGRPRSPACRASRRSRRASSPTSRSISPQLDEPASGRLISIPAERRPQRERPVPAARPLDRAGPPRRSARERGVRRRARARPRRPRAGGHQRPAAPAHDRRRGAVARVHLQHPSRRARARRQALRHLLDGPAGARRGLRHGGRIQRRRPDARARRVVRTRPSRGSIACSSRTAGSGAMPRALQLSHWTVENELAQLQSFGFMLPLVFLLVAAFILNVALTRALALQRPQIAALKALGYTNLAIGWHYLKWALVIGAARRGHRDRRRRVARAHDHRALQRVLSLSRAAVPRAARRGRGRHGADARRRGRRRVFGGAPRRARAAGRGDAARSAGAISALDARDAAASRVISAPPGAWCCAT